VRLHVGSVSGWPRIFRDGVTYLVLVLASFLLGFVFYLGGWEGLYGVFAWVDESDDALAWLGFPVMGFYVGWLMLLHGFDRYRRYNLIRNTPTAAVRAVPMGRVEVKGRVHPLSDDELVAAPFTGVRCVVFECRVEEYHEDDDGGHWETIHRRREAPPFYLRDETGALAVEAHDATWSFEEDYRETFREDERPDRIARYVEEHAGEEGLLDVDWLGGEKQRFTERVLEPGDELYVLGAARPASDASVHLPHGVEAIVKRDRAADVFLLSDAPEAELLSTRWWTGLINLGGGMVLVPGCGAVLLNLLGVV